MAVSTLDTTPPPCAYTDNGRTGRGGWDVAQSAEFESAARKYEAMKDGSLALHLAHMSGRLVNGDSALAWSAAVRLSDQALHDTRDKALKEAFAAGKKAAGESA